jgi:REP element-mobilizing transposase RayT
MLNIKMPPRREPNFPRRATPARRKPRRRSPIQLELSGRGRHGGWRRGAGRPSGRSNHYIPHVRRTRVTKNHAVHVTLSVRKGIPTIRRHPTRRIIQAIFAKESRKGFRLVHYSIRKDHLHLICEADSTLAVSRGIQRIASRIARALNQYFDRKGRFFADRFHSHVIKTPRAMRHVLSYVMLNAHKDEAKQGKTLRGPDAFTSWEYFDGWRAPQYQRRAHGPRPRDAPVTPATSWLLRKGWRRHGLIHLDEKAPPRPT